jgi:hypothetical protein
MGQYHYVVNLDKKEFIHPHKLGNGLKLREFGERGVLGALALLLACSNGRGGGDFAEEADASHNLDERMIGRWAGDRIAIVGDYAEDGDMHPEDHAGSIYNWCDEGKLRDISNDLVPVLEENFDVIFLDRGDGWRTTVERCYRCSSENRKTVVLNPHCPRCNGRGAWDTPVNHCLCLTVAAARKDPYGHKWPKPSLVGVS